MKCAVVVGHNAIAPGAWSHYLQLHEHEYHLRVVKHLNHDLIDIYHRPNLRSYGLATEQLARQVNSKHYDLVMELHFNAFDQVANNIGVGTEAIIYPGSQKAREVGERYCEAVSEKYGTINRGVKEHGPGMRGHLFLRSMRAPAIILEGFFGDEYEAQYFSDPKTYAEVILDVLYG